MSYVKKMADKISIGMAFSNIQDGNPEGEAFVSQIIADTKTICKKAVRNKWEQYQGLDTDITPGPELYCKVIDQVEIKENSK